MKRYYFLREFPILTGFLLNNINKEGKEDICVDVTQNLNQSIPLYIPQHDGWIGKEDVERKEEPLP